MLNNKYSRAWKSANSVTHVRGTGPRSRTLSNRTSLHAHYALHQSSRWSLKEGLTLNDILTVCCPGLNVLMSSPMTSGQQKAHRAKNTPLPTIPGLGSTLLHLQWQLLTANCIFLILVVLVLTFLVELMPSRFGKKRQPNEKCKCKNKGL